jgi:hypothetical protein
VSLFHSLLVGEDLLNEERQVVGFQRFAVWVEARVLR